MPEVLGADLTLIAESYITNGHNQPQRCFNIHPQQLQAQYPSIYQQFQDEFKRVKRSRADDIAAVLLVLPLAAHNAASQQQSSQYLLGIYQTYVLYRHIVSFSQWYSSGFRT